MTAQIRTFGMARMTVGSCANFHRKVLRSMEKATPAALHVEAQAPAYEAASKTLSSVVNRQQAFVATKAMQEADKIRDASAGVLVNVVKDYLTSPVAEKAAAAHLLYPQLSPYKGIGRHEQTKQSEEVNGMLGVLSIEANAAAATLLGIDPEIAALRKANEDFEEAADEKALEMNERMKVSDLDSQKLMDEANRLYEEIVRTVNAYAIVQPSEEIESFINQVNGYVGMYSDIAGSETSTDAPEPEPEIPETPDEETPDEEDGQPSVDDGEDDRPVVQ